MQDLNRSFDPRRCALTVPNELAFLPMVQGFVREYAREAGFPPEELGRLDLLLWRRRPPTSSTAPSAATRAGASTSPASASPPASQITVHDEGLPYDPSLTPEYDPGADLQSQTGAGLGSFLMQQIADAVEFHNLGSRGKETVIVKYLPADTVTAAPAGRRGAARGARARAGGRAGRSSRSARCVRSRRSRSAAASTTRTATPTSTSTCTTRTASWRSTRAATWSRRWPAPPTARSPGTRRSSSRRTRTRSPTWPSWRPRPSSAASRSPGGSASTWTPRRWPRGLHGLFIEEVTVHTFTQKFCHRLGFVDTGFLLAYSPATTAFKGIAEETGARRSVIVGLQVPRPSRR